MDLHQFHQHHVQVMETLLLLINKIYNAVVHLIFKCVRLYHLEKCMVCWIWAIITIIIIIIKIMGNITDKKVNGGKK